MALSINDPQAEALARELAEKTGQTADQAVVRSLRESLDRIANGQSRSLAEDLDEIGKRCAALPDLDLRTADEILGYDDNGLPS